MDDVNFRKKKEIIIYSNSTQFKGQEIKILLLDLLVKCVILSKTVLISFVFCFIRYKIKEFYEIICKVLSSVEISGFREKLKS